METVPDSGCTTGDAVLSIPAIAETQSGKCGDKLTWTLDDEGTLTITGTEEMFDYQTYAESDGIPHVLIDPPAATLLILPANLTIIESEAFAELTVDVIVIPASVSSIALNAFSGTNAILSATMDSYAETWAKRKRIE